MCIMSLAHSYNFHHNLCGGDTEREDQGLGVGVGVCLGHRVMGGPCDELCRDPIGQDLILRPDGQGSRWESSSEPNAL